MTNRWNIGLKKEFLVNGWLQEHNSVYLIPPKSVYLTDEMRFTFVLNPNPYSVELYRVEHIKRLLQWGDSDYLSMFIWTDRLPGERSTGLLKKFPINLYEMDVDD